MRKKRRKLPFRAVNRCDSPGHRPDMQRHHLLPFQLKKMPGLGAMFTCLGNVLTGFDDFRRNGLLLPSNCAAALAEGLPLHRGPHHRYNALVADRVGQIEARWSVEHGSDPILAREMALMRLGLLQKGTAQAALGSWAQAHLPPSQRSVSRQSGFYRT